MNSGSMFSLDSATPSHMCFFLIKCPILFLIYVAFLLIFIVLFLSFFPKLTIASFPLYIINFFNHQFAGLNFFAVFLTKSEPFFVIFPVLLIASCIVYTDFFIGATVVSIAFYTFPWT